MGQIFSTNVWGSDGKYKPVVRDAYGTIRDAKTNEVRVHVTPPPPSPVPQPTPVPQPPKR